MDRSIKDGWDEYKDRPAWIRNNRDEIAEATGYLPPHRLSKMGEWCGKYKAMVTRAFNEDETGSDDNE